MVIEDLNKYFRDNKKSKILAEYKRLITPDTFEEEHNSYHTITDIAFKLLSNLGAKKYKSQLEQEANLLYQFTISKCLSVLELSRGVSFKGSINIENLTDPFQLAPLIRSQFESFGTYNFIFSNSENEEEKLLRYNLWVLSGLMYRQRFASHAIIPGSKEKLEKEKLKIEELKGSILKMEIVKDLSVKEIGKLNGEIKRRNFKIQIKDGVVKLLSWFELFQNAGTDSHFEKLYDDFSLNSHPSNVAIFRYRDMFENGDNIKSAMTHLSFSRSIIAFLIADHIKFFPGLKIIFNAIPPSNQLVINGLNETFRGPKHKVNDIEKYFT